MAASLLQRSPQLDIAIIDPADAHFYQPGWTMVGGGIFEAAETARTMASVIPTDVSWIKAAVAAFERLMPYARGQTPEVPNNLGVSYERPEPESKVESP